MSNIWKIGNYERIDQGAARCNACVPMKIFKLTDGSIKGLRVHLSRHPDFKAKLKALEKEAEEVKERQRQSLANFVIPDGTVRFLSWYIDQLVCISDCISLFDKRLMNFVACANVHLQSSITIHSRRCFTIQASK